MHDSNRLRWLAAGLVIAFIALAAWGVGQYRDARDFKTAAENTRQQAFYNLLARVENINVLTAKALVASDAGQKTMVLTDIWRQASVGVEDLSRLPLAQFELTNTAKFLSQVGDFAHTIAQKTARGEDVTDDQWNSLLDVRKRVATLHADLAKVQERAAKGDLRWVDLAREAQRRLPQQRPEPLNTGMAALEKEVQRFPQLVYDGPFADHVVNRKPQGLTGSNISADQAATLARRFLFGDNAGNNAKLDYQGKTAGLLPAHSFRYTPGNGGTPTAIDLSVRGGHVVYMLRSRVPGKVTITVDDAIMKGLQFLSAHGITSMTPTYSLQEDNTAVITYAYLQNGIIIFPDLVKLKVALDNGEVLSYDAMHYLMNHRTRTLETPKLTMDEAQAKLDKRVDLVSKRLAVIPRDDGTEALTYEFHIRLNNEDFLTYVNALTGQEEQILQLIHAPEGDVAL